MKIQKAHISDAPILSQVAIEAFMPAHGHSSPEKDMQNYIQSNFNSENLAEEIQNSANTYYLLFDSEKLIGYYKINLNLSCEFIDSSSVVYMSRLYILPSYYNKGSGKLLLDHAKEISRKNKQSGMWLKVWIKNERAIDFYKKQGFTIIGKSDFVISENHSNPNHVMYVSL